MKTITFVAVLAILCAGSSFAQTDGQVRFLAHKQVATPGFGLPGSGTSGRVDGSR